MDERFINTIPQLTFKQEKSMEIQVRQMTENDAPTVQKLSEQLGYVLSISEIKNNIRETISSKDHTAFVALHDREIVG